jgi:hypothetical protein
MLSYEKTVAQNAANKRVEKTMIVLKSTIANGDNNSVNMAVAVACLPTPSYSTDVTCWLVPNGLNLNLMTSGHWNGLSRTMIGYRL